MCSSDLRLDELSKSVSKATEDLKRDVLTAVKQSNEVLDRKVAERLDGQRKELEASQQSLDQKLSQNLTQFNQSLTGFKTALTGLNDRVTQDEQESRAISNKVDADNKAAVSHINEANRSMTGHLDGVNKSVASVVKTLEAVSQKFSARFDEQDRRIESLSRSVEQVGQKNGTRPQNTRQTHRSSPAPSTEASVSDRHEQDADSAPAAPQTQASQSSPEETEAPAASVASIPAPVEAPVVAAPHPAEPAADRAQYERVLALFRDGDLEGARRGFTAFIASYPNSDLAPNARYWLGEAYYGAKDFKRAIDAYDKVELDYPRSEKEIGRAHV